MTTDASQDVAKRAAANRALELVEAGMTIGLGTGSTADHFIDGLAARVAQGLKVIGVPTSERSAARARARAIPLTTLDEALGVDLDVDGADEIDPEFRLIKGGGGALFREKLVASDARHVVIIADESKWVSRLGRFPLPIEIEPFGAHRTRERIVAVMAAQGIVGCEARLRVDDFGEPFVTDSSNLIVDTAPGFIKDPEALAVALKGLTGVVEHGLFVGLCDLVILGKSDGSVVIREAGS